MTGGNKMHRQKEREREMGREHGIGFINSVLNLFIELA